MNKVFIIAEAGVNHNGSLDLAIKLCDAAKNAGADCIKFQTWKTDLVISKDTEMAEYQKKNIGHSSTQYEMLKQLELSYESFKIIKEYCDNIGIKFLSTADEEESLNFLCELGMPFIKLGSGEITNIPYLRYCANKGMPIVISTGMSYLSQVEKAFYTLLENGAPEITILHCTTNYPCPMIEVNLKAIETLKSAFKCKVGYSDHTMGIEIPVAAVAMGAEIIEKHLTIDRTMDGPDHKASIEPQEFKAMVDAIRNIEAAMGDGLKKPNKSEETISKVVLKKIVAKRPIEKGAIMSEDMLTIKRVGSGVGAENWDFVVNTTACKNFDIDEPITLQ